MNINDSLKNKAIMLGWIFGIILLIGLFWRLTQGLQSYYLLRSVNNVLISINDERRVLSSLPQKGKYGLFGYWYSMYRSDDKMFVFTILNDGISIPLGSIINVDNIVTDIIPLSAHAAQFYENIPKSVINMYLTRIEKMIGAKNE